MNFDTLNELVKNEKENIIIWKNEINKLEKEKIKLVDKDEINSYNISISQLKNIIEEKEKLIKSIETKEIFKFD